MKIFALNDFFLTVRIIHGSKLTRFVLCKALIRGNSDQLKFLSSLVWFLSYKPLYFYIY
jgi:hypothetical protein